MARRHIISHERGRDSLERANERKKEERRKEINKGEEEGEEDGFAVKRDQFRR